MMVGLQRHPSVRQNSIQVESITQALPEIVQESSSRNIHLIELELDCVDLSIGKNFLRPSEDGKLESFHVNFQEMDALDTTIPAIVVESDDRDFGHARDAPMNVIDHAFE